VLLAVFFPSLAAAVNDDASRLGPGSAPVYRAYVLAGEQQLHYRYSGIATPGDSAAKRPRPVIALHQSPNSSQVYVEFLGALGSDRAVYAPDTPGYGESPPPDARPSITDYAQTMIRFAESLGLAEYDLVGYHTGGTIAVEWALMEPEKVKNLMLVGVPLLSEEQREQYLQNPWPSPAPISEEYLQREWQTSKKWQSPEQSDQSLERTFLAKLESGQTGWWGPNAVFRYPLEERLKAVQQSVTIVNPHDDLWEVTPRARQLLPNASYIELPEHGFGVFEMIPDRMAELVRTAFIPGG
jgi:pimeloyl-ACP methyl ester carboxylesterase